MFGHRYLTSAYFPGRYFPPLEDAENGAGSVYRSKGGRGRKLSRDELQIDDDWRHVRLDDDAVQVILALLIA
jgi:hypothetical protein